MSDYNANIDISIIVPFYNVARDLFLFCINSIIEQTFKNYEVIIVNDGSSNDCLEFLREIQKKDRRIKLFNQINQGVSVARNNALSMASGETICFVDADDYVAPWMLEDLWNVYREKAVDAVASCYSLTIDSSFNFERNLTVNIYSNNKMKELSLIGMNCSPTKNGYISAGPVAVLFKKSIAKDIAFPTGIKYMEDVIWNYRYYEKCKDIAIIEECVYAYRQNPNSATHTYKLSVIEDRAKSLAEIRKLIPESDENYALRVLANYSICCKCIMQTNELESLPDRIKKINELSSDSCWKSFKIRGIDKHWPKKYRIKRFMAMLGILPFLYLKK